MWADLDPFIPSRTVTDRHGPSRTADRYGGEAQHHAECGHWVMLEEPERAAAAIASLIARHT